MKVINVIQDEATPHNNLLISGMVKIVGVDGVDLYYATEKSTQYDWGRNISCDIKKPYIYGRGFNLKVILHFILNCRSQKFFVVGWSNATTKVIYLLSVVFGIKINMWFDLPNEDANRGVFKFYIRKLFYYVLRHSNVKIYCVGKITKNYFLNRGFNESKLENLPIQVDIGCSSRPYNKGTVKIFSGSRLIRDKGYDVLIKSLQNIDSELDFHVYIAGVGPELDYLKKLVTMYNLSSRVDFLGWLPPEKYMDYLKDADLFIHPARFDAFGSSAIALARGIPVIGSEKAGAVIEYVQNGVNGFTYSPEDYSALSHLITLVLSDRQLLEKMSRQALEVSSEYSIDFWSKKLIEGLH